MGTNNAAVVRGDLASQVIILREITPLMPIIKSQIRVDMEKVPPETNLNFNQSAAGEARMCRAETRSESIHHVFDTLRGAIAPSGGGIQDKKPGRDVGDLHRRGSTACLTCRLAVSSAGIAPRGGGPSHEGPPEPARPDDGARETPPHERKCLRPVAQLRRNPRMLPFVTFATKTENLVPRNMQRNALGR